MPHILLSCLILLLGLPGHMAEAATRFQQAQTAVQVSAMTFSSLNQVSLLNFLR